MEGMSERGRYRWRTRARGWLPRQLAMLIPKGRADCGAHDWYRSEASTWRCYHCEVGVTRNAEDPGTQSSPGTETVPRTV